MPQPSDVDIRHLELIRESVRQLMRDAAASHGGGPARLLDIAPQVHEGARPYFPPEVEVDTFDMDPTSGCTYIGDICERNDAIADGAYDFVVCTEVLEHTLQPFSAIAEIAGCSGPAGALPERAVQLPHPWSAAGLLALHRARPPRPAGELQHPFARDGGDGDRPLMPIHYRVAAGWPEGP